MIEFELLENAHFIYIGPRWVKRSSVKSIKSLNANISAWLISNRLEYSVYLGEDPYIRFNDPRQATLFKMTWL